MKTTKNINFHSDFAKYAGGAQRNDKAASIRANEVKIAAAAKSLSASGHYNKIHQTPARPAR